jgi:hypothetical protein
MLIIAGYSFEYRWYNRLLAALYSGERVCISTRRSSQRYFSSFCVLFAGALRGAPANSTQMKTEYLAAAGKAAIEAQITLVLMWQTC